METSLAVFLQGIADKDLAQLERKPPPTGKLTGSFGFEGSGSD